MRNGMVIILAGCEVVAIRIEVWMVWISGVEDECDAMRWRGQAEECMKVVESSRVVAASVLWWRGADREGRVGKHVCGGSKG